MAVVDHRAMTLAILAVIAGIALLTLPTAPPAEQRQHRSSHPSLPLHQITPSHQITSSSRDGNDNDADDDDDDETRDDETRYDEIWDELGCDDVNVHPQRIPTNADWLYLQAVHVGLLGDFSTIIYKPKQMDFDVNENAPELGFLVPVKVGQTEEYGRGLFATSFISQGTKVWDNNSGMWGAFPTVDDFWGFLDLLSPFHACDLLQW